MAGVGGAVGGIVGGAVHGAIGDVAATGGQKEAPQEKISDDMVTFKAKIEKLMAMKETGLLSEEEFNNMKAQLLSTIL